MAKIIISYRRSDSDVFAGRVHDRIVSRYGDESAFIDVDNIPLGKDFRVHIQEELGNADAILVIVGPRWLGSAKGGRSRIMDAADPVRIEVETALSRGIPTIPILVGNTGMPKPEQLPETLKDFPFLNAATVDTSRDFHRDLNRVIATIDKILHVTVDNSDEREWPNNKQRATEAKAQTAAEIATERDRIASEVEAARRRDDEERRAGEERKRAESEANLEAEARRKSDEEAEARRKAEKERRQREAEAEAKEEDQQRAAEDVEAKLEAEELTVKVGEALKNAGAMPGRRPALLSTSSRWRMVAGGAFVLWVVGSLWLYRIVTQEWWPSAPQAVQPDAGTSTRAAPQAVQPDAGTSTVAYPWPMPAGNYANHRYSQLNQITADNVSKLQVAWTFSTGVLRGHEGAPLVIGDVMYVHTPFPNIVYALDLNHDGKILWKYEPKQDPSVVRVMCCDTVNRGVAYGDGKIFLHQADDTLVALDAKTGKQVWWAANGDPKKGQTGTSAPLVVKDKVLVGNSGGEFGVQCSFAAYDIKSGKLVWRGYSEGPDDQILVDDKTTALGKPIGKDSSQAAVEAAALARAKDLARRSMEDRRRLCVGMDLV